VLILSSHSHWVNAVAITPNGRWALSGSHDRTLKLWDLETGSLIRSFVGHTDSIYTVAVTPDGHIVLSGSADRTVRLWDLQTGRLLHTFAEHGGPVSAVVVCPDGRHALSGCDDRKLRLWDIERRVCRAMVPLESSPLAIAVGPEGRSVVVGDRVGNVHYFQIHV
jgi:WD40 repeat protein